MYICILYAFIAPLSMCLFLLSAMAYFLVFSVVPARNGNCRIQMSVENSLFQGY